MKELSELGFTVGDWWVRPAQSTLERAGEAVYLERLQMELLVFLAERRGKTVPRDEILAGVWAQRFVEDAALTRCVSELRAVLGDEAARPAYIRTIPKRGYRLIATVDSLDTRSLDSLDSETVDSIDAPPVDAIGPSRPIAAAGQPSTTASDRSTLQRWRLTGAAAVLALLAAGLVYLATHFAADSASRPPETQNLVVLHFVNGTGRTDQDWLSEEIRETLTLHLAAAPALRAISTTSVDRLLAELSISEQKTISDSTLKLFRLGLGADLVVAGSFDLDREADAELLRLRTRVFSTRTGEIVTAAAVRAAPEDLGQQLTRVAAQLCAHLAVPRSADRDGAVAPSAPGLSSTGSEAFFKGKQMLRRLQAGAAVEQLQRAVAEAPGHVKSHLALAEAWALLGHDRKAMQSVSAALRNAASLPREQRLWAEARHSSLAGDWEAAISTFEALSVLEPANLEYAYALASAQISAGRGDEAVELLARIRAQLPDDHRDPRISLLTAEAHARLAEHSRVLDRARAAFTEASDLGADLVQGRALHLEAEALRQLGRPEEANEPLRGALDIFSEGGFRRDRGEALNTLAGWRYQQGSHQESAALAHEALELFREIGFLRGQASSLLAIADRAWRKGDSDRGWKLSQEALEIFRRLKDRAGEAQTLNTQAIAYMAFDPEAEGDRTLLARPLFEQALEIYRELDSPSDVSRVLSNLGRCDLLFGDVHAAATRFREVVLLQRNRESPAILGATLLNLGYAESEAGANVASTSTFHEAVAIFRRLDETRNLAAALGGLAHSHFQAGNLTEAERLAAENLEIRRRLGEPLALSFALGALAEVALEAGDMAAADDWSREGLEVALATAEPNQIDSARSRRALVLLAAGRTEEALRTTQPLATDQLTGNRARRVLIRARALAAAGATDRALDLLAPVREFAGAKGLLALRLEADLYLTAWSPLTPPDRQITVKKLEAEARRHGLGLIASRFASRSEKE